MRRAGRLVAETIAAMRAAVRPGVTTTALDAIAGGVLDRAGGRSAPKLVYRFPGVTCISVNDEAVHGVPGPPRVARGRFVTLDVTAELDGYMADAAVTVPVGRVSRDAANLVAAAEGAFNTAIAAAVPGTSLRDLGRAIEAHVERAGFKVLRELCGHGIGRTIHEPPERRQLRRPARSRAADRRARHHDRAHPRRAPDGRAPPGASWPVPSADGSLTAHHEHTIVVHAGGCEILTALAA